MEKVERVLRVLTRIWHKHWHSKALYVESIIFAAEIYKFEVVDRPMTHFVSGSC